MNVIKNEKEEIIDNSLNFNHIKIDKRQSKRELIDNYNSINKLAKKFNLEQ